MSKKFRKIRKKIIKAQRIFFYKLNILLLAIIILCSLSFPQHSIGATIINNSNYSSDFELQGFLVETALLPVLKDNFREEKVEVRLPKIKERELFMSNYHYVTAYNVGVVAQTDNTPCIGASGDNLCELVKQGFRVCAANFVPLGTHLKIEGIGTCQVLDRMNKRYFRRIDIAMGPDEILKAKQFGLRYKKVGIY